MRVLSAVFSLLVFNALGVLLMRAETGDAPAFVDHLRDSWMAFGTLVTDYGYQSLGVALMVTGVYVALVCLFLSQPRGRWWPAWLSHDGDHLPGKGA
jgi:hypothetical protein